MKEEEERKGISQRCNACRLVSLGLGMHLKDSQPLDMHEWRVPKAANISRWTMLKWIGTCPDAEKDAGGLGLS